MAHSAGSRPGPNQWIKDHLDALIDAQLLPEPPLRVGGRRARRAAGGRVPAVAPDAASARRP